MRQGHDDEIDGVPVEHGAQVLEAPEERDPGRAVPLLVANQPEHLDAHIGAPPERRENLRHRLAAAHHDRPPGVQPAPAGDAQGLAEDRAPQADRRDGERPEYTITTREYSVREGKVITVMSEPPRWRPWPRPPIPTGGCRRRGR
jgi:hypothetical protein